MRLIIVLLFFTLLPVPWNMLVAAIVHIALGRIGCLNGQSVKPDLDLTNEEFQAWNHFKP